MPQHQPPPPGYHGCYLRIDLAGPRVATVPLAEATLRRYLGGSGLGTYLLLQEGAAAADPLSPAAPLAFVFSPLVGSPLTTSAKFAVVSRSPLTDCINDALASSHFAIAGKQTGCDAILLTGQARQWSVLIVEDGAARLEPADELLGLTCDQTEQALRARLGSGYQFAVIGPAGERQVRFATISHGGRHAGRGGSGAILGAKRIKAIAVRGSRRARWSQPETLVKLAKDLSERSFGPATAKYRELGTAANLLVFNRLGALPTRNFQQGTFAGAAALSPEQLTATRDKTRASCAACTIGCEHIYGIRSAGSSAPGVRIEYENLFALGPMCDDADTDAVLAASRRCDELGIDTISAGGTIAFAMECVERGLLDAPWLRFGDPAALTRVIDEIGRRAGLGDLLAEGSRRAASAIGGEAPSFAPQVKGLEIPGYEPRALQTMALGFAVGTRGADHNRSGAYEVDFSEDTDRRRPGPDAARRAVETEDRAALMDSLILCKFLRGVFGDFFAESAEMLNRVTGWDTTADELRATARRIVTAKKHFNVLAGWRPEHDTLPARLLNRPLPNDPEATLTTDRLQGLIAAYNMARGWTAEGYPTPEQIAKLELCDQ